MVESTRAVVSEMEDQFCPRVCDDGREFVAVWLDYRMDGAIFASRVSYAGEVLDRIGVLVHGFPSSICMDDLACAACSLNALIVWDEVFPQRRLRAKRITRDMTILDSIPIEIDSTWGDSPRVVYAANAYLVLWVGPSGLECRRVTPDGELADTAARVLYRGTAGIERFDATADGASWLVAIQANGGEIVGLRLDSAGSVRDTILVYDGLVGRSEDGGYEMGACYTDSTYFVTFSGDSGGEEVVYGVRVRHDGVVLDTAPIALFTLVEVVEHAPVAGGAGVFLAAIGQEDVDEILGRRVSADGLLLDSAPLPITEGPCHEDMPVVAFGDGKFIVVWAHRTTQSEQGVNFSFVTAEGTVVPLNGVHLSTAAGCQWRPDAAFDGTNYLIVWSDNLDEDSCLCSVRGLIVDQQGRTVTGPFTIVRDSATSPRVCYGGGNYYVVWGDYRLNPGGRDVYGTRVTPEGVVLDPAGTPIFTRYVICRYAVEFDGEQYFVVCEAVPGSLNRVFGARVKLDGTPVDTNGFQISVDGRWESGDPVLASNGTARLVAWWRRQINGGWMDISGRLVYSNATMSDTFRISRAGDRVDRASLAVASDGSSFFVAWSGAACKGVRVSGDGRILDTASTRLGGQYASDLTFDGTNYALLRGQGAVNLSFIGPEGIPLDTAGTLLRSTPYTSHKQPPRLVCGSDGQLAVVVQDYTAAPYNTTRTYYALVNPSGALEPGLPAARATAVPCQTVVRNKLLVRLPPGARRRAVEIRGIDGRKLDATSTWVANSRSLSVDVSALPSGIYFLSLNAARPYKVLVCH